jgi:hypothetical protein
MNEALSQKRVDPGVSIGIVAIGIKGLSSSCVKSIKGCQLRAWPATGRGSRGREALVSWPA